MPDTTQLNTNRHQARLRDLEQLLGEIQGLHNELLETAQRKLLAMRQSDVAAIQHCVEREGELTSVIREREGLRRRLMVLMGKDLGMEEPAALKLSLRGLAQHLEGGAAIRLKALGDQLAAVLAQLAKVNSHVIAFARTMLDHYRAIFASLTTARQEPPVYARSGAACSTSYCVVDTTG